MFDGMLPGLPPDPQEFTMDHTPCFPVRRPSPVRNPARLGAVGQASVQRSGGERGGLRGLRLTGRGRMVVAALSLLIAAPTIGLGGQAFASAPSRPLAVQERTVAAGDTLWGFARQIAGPGEDVRDVVAQLLTINGMESPALQAGQIILLPAD